MLFDIRKMNKHLVIFHSLILQKFYDAKSKIFNFQILQAKIYKNILLKKPFLI